MARRVIKIDGDPSGLKQAAQSATVTLKAELEAQKKAVADARASQKALAKTATAEERAAAKATIAATREVLEAKRRAYADATAAAKRAAQDAREAARQEAAATKALMEGLRRDAQVATRQAQALQGMGSVAAEAESGGMSGGRAVAAVSAALFGLVKVVGKTIQAMEEFERNLTERTMDAAELATKRAEALRLAGVDPREAGSLGKTVGAINNRISSSKLSSALEQAAEISSGDLSSQAVQQVLKLASGDSAGAALGVASYGLDARQAVRFSERFTLSSRGGKLTREQAQAVPALLAGGAFKSEEEVADYLVAADAAGVSVSDIIGHDTASTGRANASATADAAARRQRLRAAQAAEAEAEKRAAQFGELKDTPQGKAATRDLEWRREQRQQAEREAADADTVAERTTAAAYAASASAPFRNVSPALGDGYRRLRQRASSRQVGPSFLEILRNEDENQTNAYLATSDQSAAAKRFALDADKRRSELVSAQQGQTLAPSLLKAIPVVGQEAYDIAGAAGVLPNQGKPLRVEVSNPDRQSAER